MAIELEHILFRLHNRVSRWAAAFFDAPARRFIAVTLLVLAVLSYLTFFYLHAEYIGYAADDCLTKRISGVVERAGGVEELHLFRLRIVTEQVAAADKLRRVLVKEAREFHQSRLGQPSGPLLSSDLLACDGADAAGEVGIQGEWAALRESCASPSQPGSGPAADATNVTSSSDRKATARAAILSALSRYLLVKTGAPIFAPRPEDGPSLGDPVSTLTDVIQSLQLLMEEEAMDRTQLASAERASRDTQSRAVLNAAKNLVFALFSNDGFNSMYIPEPVVASFEAARGYITQLFSSSEAAPPEKLSDGGTDPSSANSHITAVSARLIDLYKSILQALVLRSTDMERRATSVRSDDATDAGRGRRRAKRPPAPYPEAHWQIESAVQEAIKQLYLDPVMLVMMTSILGSDTADGNRSELVDFELLHPLTSVPAGFKPSPEPSFLFALDNGLLTLSAEMRDRLNVSLVQLDVDASQRCVGTPLSRWLLRHLVGYDTAVVNAVISAVGGRGFVLAEHSGEVHALGHATEVHSFSDGYGTMVLFKIGTFCSAVFLLFASSSLVSFILAQTQQRMLKFTVSLQHNVRAQLPLLPLVASHLVDSLVFVPIMLGVLFFLFEFFSDQLLAFLVLLVVWLCELWSITSCRTIGTLRVFPRIFGLLLTWFHVYYLAYPFGFHYIALGSTSLALLCTIFHLWDQYEWPALADGVISGRNPRIPEVAAIMNIHFRERAERVAQPAAPDGPPPVNASAPRANEYPSGGGMTGATDGPREVRPSEPAPPGSVRGQRAPRPADIHLPAPAVVAAPIEPASRARAAAPLSPGAESGATRMGSKPAGPDGVSTPPRHPRADASTRSPLVERLASMLDAVRGPSTTDEAAPPFLRPDGNGPSALLRSVASAFTQDSHAVSTWAGEASNVRTAGRSAWM